MRKKQNAIVIVL